MQKYMMTTALLISAIAVNSAFAEDTPVLKVDTTSQEKVQAANEASSSSTQKNISDKNQDASASVDVKTNAIKDTKAEATTTNTQKESAQTKTNSQADNTKNTYKNASHAKAEVGVNATTETQKESAQTETNSQTDNIKNTNKNTSDAKPETETQNVVAQKKKSDDIVTNSIKTDDEAEKTEPQGVMDKIFAYFSGE